MRVSVYRSYSVMSNDKDSIPPATKGQPNAANREDIRQRVRKLHEDVKHLSETLDRDRQNAAEAVAANSEDAS